MLCGRLHIVKLSGTGAIAGEMRLTFEAPGVLPMFSTLKHRIVLETPTKNLVLFVCSGNICRSPMAAKLVEHALHAEGEPLNRLKVASCGTSAMSGMPASRNAVFALSKVGIPLDGHSSQPVSQSLLDQSALVVCMTSAHRDAILSMYEVDPSKLVLMREWVGDSPADKEIPDPYGGDVPVYLECRDSMVEAVPSLIRYLRELFSSN